MRSLNLFLKTSNYLKTCPPDSLEHRVPRSTLNSLWGCWRSTAIAAWGSISIEADGKCLCCSVIGNALGKCQFVVDISKQELSQQTVWPCVITSNGPDSWGNNACCPTSPRGFVLGEALDPVVGVGRSMMGLIYNRKCLHSKEKKSTVGAI